jgi:hypothetical protein
MPFLLSTSPCHPYASVVYLTSRFSLLHSRLPNILISCLSDLPSLAPPLQVESNPDRKHRRVWSRTAVALRQKRVDAGLVALLSPLPAIINDSGLEKCFYAMLYDVSIDCATVERGARTGTSAPCHVHAETQTQWRVQHAHVRAAHALSRRAHSRCS